MQPSETQRIPPIPEDEWDDELRALIDRSWSGPPPGNRNNLYRTMSRHRELFRVWNDFGRIVFNSQLPRRERQLLVLRTAWLTQCRFEWAYHEPLASVVGISSDELRRILDGPDAPGWEEHDEALLRAADELHATARLTDATWERLRARYNDQELIEIPTIVGQYHLVAYITNSLQLAPDPGLPPLPIA